MDKVSKEEAKYESKAKMTDYCKDCEYYIDANTWQNCQRVLGHVKPKAWCKFFSRA